MLISCQDEYFKFFWKRFFGLPMVPNNTVYSAFVEVSNKSLFEKFVVWIINKKTLKICKKKVGNIWYKNRFPQGLFSYQQQKMNFEPSLTIVHFYFSKKIILEKVLPLPKWVQNWSCQVPTLISREPLGIGYWCRTIFCF